MGELPKYYVHDCHPAIIDRETFRKVQEEIARRASKKRVSTKAKTELGKYSGKYALSELLICGECGSPYRRTTYMPHGERVYVWRCLNRMENGKRICKHSPTFAERDLHGAVVSAVNELFSQQATRDAVRDCVTSALARAQPELSLPALENQLRLVEKHQKELLGLAYQDANNSYYDSELQKILEVKAQLLEMRAEMERTHSAVTELDLRIERIESELALDSGTITKYDDTMARQLISNIKVLDWERLLIRFKDGTEVEQIIEKSRGAKGK